MSTNRFVLLGPRGIGIPPTRNAVLLVAGDKARVWKRWYADNVPLAEARYEKWLAGEYAEEGGGL